MKLQNTKNARLIVALAAMASLHLSRPPADAASFTWVASGATGGWATRANWSPNNLFPNTGYTGTDLIIQIDSRSTAITTSDNITSPLSVNQIHFETGTGNEAVTLTVSAGSASLNFVADGTTGPSIVQNSGASVLINGNGTTGVGGITLQNNLSITGTGSGLLTISTIISGTGKMTIDRSGIVVLNGANTFSGGVTLDKGIIRMATGSPAVLGSGTFSMNGGRISTVSSSPKVLSNAIRVGEAAAATFGDSTLNGVLTFNGAANFGAGSKVVAESNVLFQNTSITLGGNVTFEQKENAQISLNNLDAAGGVTFELTLGSTPFNITNALTNSDSSLLKFALNGGTTGVVYTLVNFGSSTIDYSQLQLAGGDYILDSTFGTGGWLINENNLQVQLIPEPATIGLAILGLPALGLYSLRRRWKN